MSTDKNKETVENNQQSIEEQERELKKRFPSSSTPTKELLRSVAGTLIIILIAVICIGTIIREWKLRDSEVVSSKEYTATIANKYATAGLTDNMNYVLEVETTEGNKFVLYISESLWNTVEEGKDYKLVISNTKAREGKISLEVLEDSEEKESETQK